MSLFALNHCLPSTNTEDRLDTKWMAPPPSAARYTRTRIKMRLSDDHRRLAWKVDGDAEEGEGLFSQDDYDLEHEVDVTAGVYCLPSTVCPQLFALN